MNYLGMRTARLLRMLPNVRDREYTVYTEVQSILHQGRTLSHVHIDSPFRLDEAYDQHGPSIRGSGQSRYLPIVRIPGPLPASRIAR